MKFAKILIMSILSVFLIGLVNAELGVDENQLFIDIDAKVDGKSAGSSLADGEEITRDAEPESSVKITINIENRYDSDLENYDIEDVEITATLESIDDEGDEDLEEEGEISRIRPGRTGKETFTFEVPLRVDEGTYNLNIDIEFDDEKPNATIDSQSLTLTLIVEKEKHNVIINKFELSRNNIECIKQTTLNVEIMNLGQEEEDETVLEIVNEDLGINVREMTELNEDPFDDENTYSKTVAINTEDLKTGTYPIVIRAYRNEDRLEATKNIDLVVLECVVEEEEEEITVAVCGNGIVETGEACDDGNLVSGDGCSSLCTVEGTTPTGYTPLELEENFWEQYGTTVMIIGGELLFLLVILIVVAVALRKR